MGDRISIRRAFSDLHTSKGLLGVVCFGTLTNMLTGASSRPLMALGGVLGLLFLGYTVSYARRIAIDESSELPPLGQAAHLRRCLGMLVISALPSVALILFWGAVISVLGAITPLSLGRSFLVSSLAAVIFLAGLYTYLFGARYVFTDRVREGLWYLDALRRFRRSRGAGWILFGFTLACSLGLWIIDLALEKALGSTISLGQVTAQFADGRASVGTFVLLGAVILTAAVSAYVVLATANLWGQYARVALQDSES
ncbi:MAG: hypothetical protein AB2L09_08305 [Coriobacteriia bacterium]